MPSITWLLLLYSLPTRQNTARVAVWRKFKKIGAIQIKTSTYLLPDQPAQYEHFQWLAQQIRDYGGDATLVRAQQIEGMPNERLVALFNRERDREFGQLKKALHGLLENRKKRTSEMGAADLERLTRQFREISEVDFFQSPRGQDVQMLLRRAEGGSTKKLSRLDRKNYRGRTWATRPRPEIDRVGSAWLIRKFIDPQAKFMFSSAAPPGGEAIAFDMVDVV